MAVTDAIPVLAERVRAGDARAIARAMSLVEDETAAGAALVRAIHPDSGRAHLIGVTGAPGAGKSTLVDRLIAEIRQSGRTVGVIAVDPTSPFTGGAILGDRVRMNTHAGDAGVFIRSMATRGQLGGLARATADLALILDVAGKDIVIIETVGVGQDEVDIVRTADVAIVVLVPGTGDDVQAIKAGIMEIADIYVVNKADREGADRLVQAIAANLSLQTFADGAWQPPILKTDATGGVGITPLLDAVSRFLDRPQPRRDERRRARAEAQVRDLLVRGVLRTLQDSVPQHEMQDAIAAVAARTLDPYTAADRLLQRVAGVVTPKGHA